LDVEEEAGRREERRGADLMAEGVRRRSTPSEEGGEEEG